MCTVLLSHIPHQHTDPMKSPALPGVEIYILHIQVPSQDVLLKRYIIYKDCGSSEPDF